MGVAQVRKRLKNPPQKLFEMLMIGRFEPMLKLST
jgi:hypothetical protein